MPTAESVKGKQTAEQESQFQRRWEPTFHWRGMCSMLLGSAVARALYPMSSVDFQQPECTDVSGHGYHLRAAAALGNVTFGQDPNGIAPIAVFGGGANQYLFRADGGVLNWADIGCAGGDVQIIAAQRGLSLGGWFWWSALPGVLQYLMAKQDGGANLQYDLWIWNTNNIAFRVWPGPVQVTSTATINTGWNHCAGVYDQPSQTLYVVLNGVVTAGVAGAAPAALADTAAAFTVGADGAGGNRFTGYGSDGWLCAASLALGFVRAGFHYTKAAFGVK